MALTKPPSARNEQTEQCVFASLGILSLHFNNEGLIQSFPSWQRATKTTAADVDENKALTPKFMIVTKHTSSKNDLTKFNY